MSDKPNDFQKFDEHHPEYNKVAVVVYFDENGDILGASARDLIFKDKWDALKLKMMKQDFPTAQGLEIKGAKLCELLLQNPIYVHNPYTCRVIEIP